MQQLYQYIEDCSDEALAKLHHEAKQELGAAHGEEQYIRQTFGTASEDYRTCVEALEYWQSVEDIIAAAIRTRKRDRQTHASEGKDDE